ncbi:hypothetical protein LNP74_00655 [Klebsiella pneumoniae subsp. pneumoniae]|nr:hypothetical protein [Klebsiella pneumoniae subsp. pneumoniae]
MKPNPDYRPPLKWVSLDIETSRHGELYCTSVWKAAASGWSTCWAPGTGKRRQDVDFAGWSSPPSRPLLLEKLNAWLLPTHDPDVLIGWNAWPRFDLRVPCKSTPNTLSHPPLRLGRGSSELEWA